MQYRFRMIMSITLLTATAGVHAAESSTAMIKLSEFKKESDIPNSTQWKCAAAGFLVGSTQQTVTFPSILYFASPENAGITLLGQWLICFGLSAVFHSACARNVEHLAKHNTECARMIFNQRAPLGTDASMQEFATRHNRLQEFIRRYKDGHHTADDRKTYNDLLESNIKWRSFWGGYWLASAFGPIPPFAAAYTLMKLGKLPC